MAITREELSPTKWVFQDGATKLLELDSSSGVWVNSLTIGRGNDNVLTASLAELNALDGIASTVTVALTASTAANEMVITITAKDVAAATVAAVHQLEFWMSEATTGIGLTADAYSGDLVASTGAIHSAHTAKKHWSVVTAATGIFVGVLTDSAKPADQYVAIKKPLGAGIVVSAASGVNWGA
jgi:hypothetical protein